MLTASWVRRIRTCRGSQRRRLRQWPSMMRITRPGRVVEEVAHESPPFGCRAEKGEFLARLFTQSDCCVGKGARSQIAVGLCGRMAPAAFAHSCRVVSYELSLRRLTWCSLRASSGTFLGV